jgi:two-component system, cell cycle sensor histidine kinase and response regulator CckA
VMLTTSLARMDPALAPDMRSHLRVIDDATRRAAEITQRLLTFGRRSDDATKPVRVAAVVENCFGLLRPTMDRRIEWVCNAPANFAPVLFNPTDLNQVMFNLVINARDALLEKLAQPAEADWTPRLVVTVEELPQDAMDASSPPGSPPGTWQRITVADNGVGIAPEIVDRIFEPFFTTKEVGRGTGLGLSTVWHLVTEAGGNIAVESKLGVGTKIHVWLPRGANVPAAAAAEPARAPAQQGRSLRVLLVEDEDLVAQVAVLVLQRSGHVVSRAGDGVEAWAKISERSGDFDLLLADVNMPRMSGVDLVRRVRDIAFPGRIVIMGGRVTDDERRSLQALRVDRILSKPFTAAELVETIQELFPSAGNAAA